MRYSRWGFRLNAVSAIIAVTFVVFVATIVSPHLIFLLGLQPLGLSQRPWTIVTSLFVHGGLWHILANMLTLYFFGTSLVRLLGEGRFLFIYFGGGILGSIAYVLLAPPFTLAIGASGAVFALGGALTALTPKLRVIVFPIPAPIPLWAAVLGAFLILSLLPGIAWQSHLGGLVFGLAAGRLFRGHERYVL
ncbi:MAG: rhomboid family intramembrane serine protease [Chloroflexi bacterium]|nr:rhomboid family intramembrane serine protease [Chloroflexota bacterium]